jgi:hypothetical protein
MGCFIAAYQIWRQKRFLELPWQPLAQHGVSELGLLGIIGKLTGRTAPSPLQTGTVNSAACTVALKFAIAGMSAISPKAEKDLISRKGLPRR